MDRRLSLKGVYGRRRTHEADEVKADPARLIAKATRIAEAVAKLTGDVFTISAPMNGLSRQARESWRRGHREIVEANRSLWAAIDMLENLPEG